MQKHEQRKEIHRRNTPITLPYGEESLRLSIPSENRVLFDGSMEYYPPAENVKALIRRKLEKPNGTGSLSSLISPGSSVLVLIEDNTRDSPLIAVLEVLLDYLPDSGVSPDEITLMTAPGTHRVMTEQEILNKLGKALVKRVKIIQHDYTDGSSMDDLGTVRAGETDIPIQINGAVLEADFIIATGNIKPHPDAGYSGGAKMLEPGVCGYATTAATHVSAALLEEIPLGTTENPCRRGIEAVAAKAGLGFIINTVTNYKDEIIDIVAGDFIQAHREGAQLAAQVYGVHIPEPADIVIVSSFPADMDWWQANKGLIAAYFAVKQGGTIIFITPATEGLQHNHPQLIDWLACSWEEAKERALRISFGDEREDLVAADIAMCNSKVREKAEILLVSGGLTDKEVELLGYTRFSTPQEALDYALQKNPCSSVGILPRGGDALPILQ
ncbi:MAG: nickel-dependent lactate racemase [Spirochaetaceae bacterium]